ncbi:MAG: hypothetical protein WC755_02635 [Candidatus Woesearchaeota archaeon]|jgi:hypothetical protein
MTKKKVTNKQKELLLDILKNHTLKDIEHIIELLYENKIEEIKEILKKENKETIDKVLSITKDKLKELEYDEKKETETKNLAKDGYKKPENIESKIKDTDKITKENFEKHPAHFKYAAYLINQIEEQYHDSNIRLKLRKTFLGEDKTSNTYHGVKMYDEFKKKEYNKGFKDSNQLLRKDFNDEELIKIANSLIATLRDYYYKEFLGLKNYDKYVIKKSDSDEVKADKTDKLRFLDASITSKSGDFGMSNERIFDTLKQIREIKVPFGKGTMMDYVEQHIINPMMEKHREETKEKILQNTITENNFIHLQHALNDKIKNNNDLSEGHIKNIEELYREKSLHKARNIFSQIMPKGMGNYNVAEKEQFEQMQKIYGSLNEKYKEAKKEKKKLKGHKDYIADITSAHDRNKNMYTGKNTYKK